MDIQHGSESSDEGTVLITLAVILVLAVIAFAIWSTPPTTEAGSPPAVKSGQPAPTTSR